MMLRYGPGLGGGGITRQSPNGVTTNAVWCGWPNWPQLLKYNCSTSPWMDGAGLAYSCSSWPKRAEISVRADSRPSEARDMPLLLVTLWPQAPSEQPQPMRLSTVANLRNI